MTPEAPTDLAAFCRREFPRLVGALDLHCGDLDVAEEMAQEALVRAAERWEQVRRMAAPGAWVYRVAINLANSWFRRRAAERRAKHRAAPIEEGRRDPDGADRVAVREALVGLPTRQRQAVVLRFYLGCSVAETAAVMGTPEGTVKTLVHRGLGRLRRQLGPARPPDVPVQSRAGSGWDVR